MSENSFHMEVLSNSIHELQQEKARCEHKLRDLRNKRQALEKKCEGAVTKYNQMEEKLSKMVETVKIAQHKVNQSQAELDGQHAVNNELQNKVQQVEHSCSAADEQHSKDIELFEAKLAELVDKFHRSRHFYTDESLLKEIDLMKQKENEFDQETGAVKQETEKMNQVLSELSGELEDKKRKQEEFGISAAQQREVLSMMMAENEDSGRVVQEVQERRQVIKDEVEQLSQWKPPQDINIEE